MDTRAVIFSDRFGWHERQLCAAFRSMEFSADVVSLSSCRFAPGDSFGGLVVPGFETELPAIAFVRGISAGTFEQVTFRLDILHALQEMSVRVVNPARVIERTVDKAMTSHLLTRNSVPNVPAWSFESLFEAQDLIYRKSLDGIKFVLKPLFGSMGRGLRLLDSENEVPDSEEVAGVYYLQEYVPSTEAMWRDWRVMVSGQRAVCAMERRSSNWITNRSQGASCYTAEMEAEVLRIAEQAVMAVGGYYGGVDMIHTPQGEWKVLEVNGVPAWQGLQSVSEINIADTLVADAVAQL